MGHVQKTLAPDMPSVSRETEGKTIASLCLGFLIKWGFGQTISLVTSKILFLAAGRILDPSVFSPFHVLSQCRDEGKPNYRCLCSHTEVLVKYCLRFLTLVRSSLSRTSLVSYFQTLHHKLIRMVACWLLFYYGSDSIIFLQNVTLTKCTFLVHYPMKSWHIVLSLLPF